MLTKKKWNVLNNFQFPISNFQFQKLITLLLENRNIKTKEEIEGFLYPQLEDVTVDAVGIDRTQLKKTLQRIQKAIDEKEQIVVFGDYDVDGITGTAILWETLYSLGANVLPYIPDRVDEGYGLSIAGISNLKSSFSAPADAKAMAGKKATADKQNIKLIITVDNGVVAHEAAEFANKQGIDVIITDHHTRSEKDPDAYAIVHTTKLCGAGVAYLLAQEIINYQLSIINEKENPPPVSTDPSQEGIKHISSMGGVAERPRWVTDGEKHLELVCLATVADLVPLTGANRTLVKFGLKALRNTQRVGLLALFSEAGIDVEKIGVYEIGHVIGPRLNAMGRMASAMDSLRLLCTKDANRAQLLAATLGRTNRERQLLTTEMAEHAIESLKSSFFAKASQDRQISNFKKILFIADETYEQGVIGLVASKLVEMYYRPAIVLSIGETYSKASARSITGFNIIEFIRSSSHLLINAGGHPMAAGFTVETEKLSMLQEAMELLAEQQVTDDMLVRNLKIDCELPLEVINQDVYDAIQQLSPFGMGNPEPIFVSRDVIVQDIRVIGQEGKHLKLQLRIDNGQLKIIEAVAFGFGELFDKIKIGDAIAVAYVVDENEWQGNKKLQLKVKDIQLKNFQ